MFYGCTHCFQAFTAAFCHHFCFLLFSISVWILFSVLVLFSRIFPLAADVFIFLLECRQRHTNTWNSGKYLNFFLVENSLGILFYFLISRVVCLCMCCCFSLYAWTYADWLHRFDSADLLILLLSFQLAHFSHVILYYIYRHIRNEHPKMNG